MQEKLLKLFGEKRLKNYDLLCCKMYRTSIKLYQILGDKQQESLYYTALKEKQKSMILKWRKKA